MSFQSTPSVGRATINLRARAACGVISIHALRGEGDIINTNTNETVYISIHALRGEGDGNNRNTDSNGVRFQSTPSVGRATL